MKEIAIEIKDFLKKDFNTFAYSYTFIFLSVSLFFNYKYNFENSYIDLNYGKPIGFLIYPLYYIAPYYIIIIPVLFIKKQQYKLKQTEFWVKSIVYFATFGIMVAMWQDRNFVKLFNFETTNRIFAYKIIGELKRLIPFLIIFFAVKSYYDKKETHLLGLRYKGIKYRPFFVMLLLMLPLIAIASFQPDFQRSYPQFKFWNYDGAFNMSSTQNSLIYELVYGMDFISIELLFRGALVIGMAKVLGREAVLPMAAAYVIIHFGKPAGEAISSFFGGFILGVHALKTNNIFGGIIIHVGIAYLMEISAILQHFYG